MDNPLVSIVICCHNREEYLAETLESVLAQTYAPVEIILMDDGSTDRSDEIAKSYVPHIQYHQQEQQGIAVARTNASRLATGDYIAYQDDDDLMLPNRIETLIRALNGTPNAILATGDYELIDADSRKTGNRWLPVGDHREGSLEIIDDGQEAILWPRTPAVPHTTLFRRKDGERINWFDHEFRYACSDADFLARLGQSGSVVHVRSVVSYYRRGHAQIWADDVRTTISQVQLWSKHLGTMTSSQGALARQIRQRLLWALLKLDYYDKLGQIDAAFSWANKRRDAVYLLSPVQRVKFIWRSTIHNNLRQFLNRDPK